MSQTSTPPGVETRPAKPNVIVFFTDQQRWDTCGIHGNPLGLTPNLDRAALEGTDFHRCFTCQPVCGPTRAVLQSGVYPTTNGTHTNGRALPKDSTTLARLFNQAGYRTGYIGKWHLGDDQIVPADQRGGYQDWLGVNALEMSSDAYQTRMWDENNNPVDLPGYRVDACADAAIRYIDKNKERPFFLFLSFIEPHFQNHIDSYPAPDGYEEKYTARWTPPDLQALGGTSAQHLPGYYGMVKRLDEAYGRVRDALKSLHLDRDTIVLFTSDHGCHFKTRNDEYKRSGHESSIRIPCVATGPGFEGGGRIKKLVSNLDIPPTLLDAAGLGVPAHFQGASALPLARDHRAPWRDDMYVQISESSVARALRTERFKYIVTAPNAHQWHDATAAEYAETELYDLHADPWELTNLVEYKTHRGIMDALRDRMLKRMKEAGEPEPRIIPAVPTVSGQRMVLENELGAGLVPIHQFGRQY